MRTASNDPDVRRYDRNEDFVACPQCHSWMLPLRDFELQRSSAGPTPDLEWYEFLIWGWWPLVTNYIVDSFTFEKRRKQLATQKTQALPQFPNSLICPHCDHIQRRP